MFRVVGKNHERIAFIGGPFDGHSQLRDQPDDRLPLNVVWLVCNDAFEELDLKRTSAPVKANHASLTSVALYRLDGAGETEVYRFAGALSASQFGEMLSGQDYPH